MSFTLVLGTLTVLTIAGFYLGRSRSLASAGGAANKLHSRPHYYGYFVALWCGIPTMLILGLWTVFQTPIVEAMVQSSLPDQFLNTDASQMSLIMNDIRNLASGNITSVEVTPALQRAADHYSDLQRIGRGVACGRFGGRSSSHLARHRLPAGSGVMAAPATDSSVRSDAGTTVKPPL